MPVQRTCLVCAASFTVPPSKIGPSSGQYCSKSCAGYGRNKRDPCICLVCHTPFFAKPSRIRKGTGKYCSRACGYKARSVSPTCVMCRMCGKPIILLPRQLARGGGKYCSQQCYHHRTGETIASRFWSSVLKTDTCWLWQGKITGRGYGRFALGDTGKFQAHRFAYELTYGPILPGLFCLHHCDVRTCVRPDHLFLGTQGDNMRDMVQKQRHGSVIHPERVPRGEMHPRRLHPEQFVRGEQSPHAKLTESQVREIRHLRATEQLSYVRLAARFGVSPTLIIHIVKGKIWRHIL